VPLPRSRPTARRTSLVGGIFNDEASKVGPNCRGGASTCGGVGPIDRVTVDRKRLEPNLLGAEKEAAQRAPSRSKLRIVKIHLMPPTKIPVGNHLSSPARFCNFCSCRRINPIHLAHSIVSSFVSRTNSLDNTGLLILKIHNFVKSGSGCLPSSIVV
jgi:hypothetical protein